MKNYPMRDIISSASIWSLGSRAIGWGRSGVSTDNFPAANDAIIVPLYVTEPFPVRKVWWANGTAIDAGADVDVGVFEWESFNRVFSIGSTAQSGAAAPQTVSLGSTVLLPVGRYRMALACDDTGSDFLAFGWASATRIRGSGVLKQASAFALPSTLTPVAPTADFVPFFGISRRT